MTDDWRLSSAHCPDRALALPMVQRDSTQRDGQAGVQGSCLWLFTPRQASEDVA